MNSPAAAGQLFRRGGKSLGKPPPPLGDKQKRRRSSPCTLPKEISEIKNAFGVFRFQPFLRKRSAISSLEESSFSRVRAILEDLVNEFAAGGGGWPQDSQKRQ